MASAAPTIPARTTRGSRNCQRIVSHVAGRSTGAAMPGTREARICATAGSGMATEPWLAATSATAANPSAPHSRRHHG